MAGSVSASTRGASQRRHCGLCRDLDNEEMVACDKCAQWFHFKCVGVTEEVANVDWECERCRAAEIRPASIKSKTSSARKKLALLELSILEEEKNLAAKRDEEQRKLAEKRDAEYLEKKREILINAASSDDEEDDDVVDSEEVKNRTSSWVNNNNVPPPCATARQSENNSNDLCDPIPCSSAAGKVNLNEIVSHIPLQVSTDVDESNQPPPTHLFPHVSMAVAPTFPSVSAQQSAVLNTRIADPIQKPLSHLFSQVPVPVPLNQPSLPVQMAAATSQNNNVITEREIGQYSTPIFASSTQPTSVVLPPAHNCAPFPPFNNHAPRIQPPDIACAPQQHLSSIPPFVQLHPAHYAARQALPRELPTFTGKPEEWPIFISSYEGTTSACGFSNAENAIRLQRCLKGRALDAVSCRLLVPSSIPSVIETLRLMFGRPELIIHNLLQKVRDGPAPKAENLESVIDFALSVQNLCGVMEACGLLSHLNNPTILQELVGKLPASIKLNWAYYQQTTAASNLSTFSEYMFRLAQAASSVNINESSTSETSKNSQRTQKFKAHIHAHVEDSLTDQQEQSTGLMETMTRRERWKRVIAEKLCARCLLKHSSRCPETDPCGRNGCQRRHHPLLHNDHHETSAATTHVESTQEEPCHTHRNVSNKSVLFRIVPVILHGRTKSINTFAFLDEGSSLTMIEKGAAAELELEGTPENLCLRWTADTIRTENDSLRVSLGIAGTQDGCRRYTLNDVRTVEKLSFPVQTMCLDELIVKYPHLNGLPPLSYCNASPRILIGIDNWKLGLPSRVREGKWREPIASETKLGWTIQGLYHHQENTNEVDVNSNNQYSFHLCECKRDDELHVLVKEFFTIENFGMKELERSPESIIAKRERRLLETTTRYLSNRYETGLLWKFDNINLPNSLPMARRRWHCLLRKMTKDPALAANLSDQIKNYVEKGYARKLTKDEANSRNNRTWYLPVFAVTNHNKPRKSSNGVGCGRPGSRRLPKFNADERS